jgi:hypothetical protein
MGVGVGVKLVVASLLLRVWFAGITGGILLVVALGEAAIARIRAVCAAAAFALATEVSDELPATERSQRAKFARGAARRYSPP